MREKMIHYKYKSEFFIFLSLLLAGGFLSVWLGQDNNWDLKNYHLYNAWAVLNGRMGRDIFAAGIQTYFNPLLDLPYYFIAIQWLPGYPRVVAFLAGLPYGALVFLTWLVTRKVTASIKFNSAREAQWAAVLAVLFGVTGSASIAQLGTTFNEIQQAAFNMAGFLCLLIRAETHSEKPRLTLTLLAGALFGLAAGLKLTSIPFTVGAVLALLVTVRSWKDAITSLFYFGMAWSLAFGLVYAWWGFRLWQFYGNPFFPLSIMFSPSPWMGHDSTNIYGFYKPKSVFEAIFYPFFWITQGKRVTETGFADSRFAFAWLGVLLFALSGWFKEKPKASADKDKKNPIISIFIIFTVTAYVVWESLFSVLRYAVPLEMLSGVLFTLGVSRWGLGRKNSLPALLCAMLVFVTITTHYPVYGRTGYTHTTFKVEIPPLPKNSLVLLIRRPIGYAAVFMKTENGEIPEFIGIDKDDYPLVKQYKIGQLMQTKIREHKGPIFLLARSEWQAWDFLYAEFGISIDLDACQIITSHVDSPLKLCLVKLSVSSP